MATLQTNFRQFVSYFNKFYAIKNKNLFNINFSCKLWTSSIMISSFSSSSHYTRYFSDLPKTRHFTSTQSSLALPRNSSHWKWPTANSRDPKLKAGSRIWYPQINSEEDARSLALNLDPTGRFLLMEQLKLIETQGDINIKSHPINYSESLKVFLVNCLPFIGFGFLDNAIMIVAGEYIDMFLGIHLGISTMAAAALGNLTSDLAGLTTANSIERVVERMDIIQPSLSQQEFNSNNYKFLTFTGRVVGITVGCLLGMIPLLFFDHKDKKDKEKSMDQIEEEIEKEGM